MFELKSNQEIGKNFSKLIKRQYKNQSRFAKEFIQRKDKVVDVSAEKLQNMSNRISQICKGTKGIQITDLPFFTEMLGVTCEEILSAGKNFVHDPDRLTNYSVAFSTDLKTWDKYINREEKPILNPDEYGNTVIDYALQFKNFAFLKYLMDNDYIWFVDADKKDYTFGFGAGTSIERRQIEFQDSMQYHLDKQDKLRMQMIALAIENNDIEMLTELRARETPFLYHYAFDFGKIKNNDKKCQKDITDNLENASDEMLEYSSYQNDITNNLENASDEILEYFSDEFVLEKIFTSKNGPVTHTHKFMFPLLSGMLDKLIDNKNKYAKTALEKAVSHNKNAYDTLQKMMDNEIKDFNTNYGVWFSSDSADEDIATEINKIRERKKSLQDNIGSEIMRYFEFYDDCNIVKFLICVRPEEKGIVTNIFQTNGKTNNDELKSLIEQLNDLYRKIRDISPQLTEGEAK